MNEEKLIEALKEIDKQCKYLNYQRCPDCDYPSQCSNEKGCLAIEKYGGDSIQQIVRKVLNGR